MKLGESIEAAADIIWQCWRDGRKIPNGLPVAIRPFSRTHGYAIQAALARRSGAALSGWKIAATSPLGQEHIGVDGPLAGRLLSDRVFKDGAEVSLVNNLMRVAEAEFAFRMKRRLPEIGKPYGVNDVLEAVDTLHPAIEIPDSRYKDFVVAGAPQLIADNACANYFVMGPAAPDAWRSVDLIAHEVTACIPGKTVRTGTGALVLGDPRIALTWIANELAQLGTPLEAGQVVTTGTCVQPLAIQPDDTIIVDMGHFGRVSARLSK